MKTTSLLFILVLITAAIFVFSRCKTPNKTDNTPAPDSKLISMYSGPCFGSCPVYTMTVYQNGVVDYMGERFTDKAGTWSKKLDAASLKDLKDMIANGNLMQMQDNYESRIPDLAMVKITYFEGDKSKEIKGKEDRPQELMAIEKMLKGVVSANGWTLQKAPDYGLEENEMDNEIIVQLKDGVEVEEFLKTQQTRFSQVKMKERVAPNQNYYVITYDPSAIAPKSLLSQIKTSEMVVDASFNKRVKMRE